MNEVTVVTKMTVKDIGCNPKKVTAMDKNADGTPVRLPLCKIYGVATGYKSGEDKRTGTVFTALTGSFEAQNLQEKNEDGTPKVYQSGKLFLPAGIQETIEEPLRNAKDNDQVLSVEFGFEIYAVQASNPIGYSYQAKPLLQASATDALSRVRELMAPKPEAPAAPQLPAPAPTPAPATHGKRK
jgi:hypothetical protein